MSNKEPERDPEIGKASAEELVRIHPTSLIKNHILTRQKLTYLRRMTGTQVCAIPASDLKAPRRPNESRAWDHRNLWCADCRKTCPICNITCCVKEEMAQKAADESLDPEKVHQAKRLGKIIEHLGAHAKDVSTFTQCTPPDGCGRYVCASCSGVCPSEICRDIQCKVSTNNHQRDTGSLMKHVHGYRTASRIPGLPAIGTIDNCINRWI